MHAPKPPPEAVLIRLARKAAGATVEETARAAGISKAWLSSIENGYDTRADDGIRAVRAKDEVVARLADFLHISPERLESEGQRHDAALVLAEMHRQQESTREDQFFVPDREFPDDDPVVQYAMHVPGFTPQVREGLVNVARSPGLAADLRRALVNWAILTLRQDEDANSESA